MCCSKCGAEVGDNVKFCPSCGSSINGVLNDGNMVKLVIRRPKKFFGCLVPYKLFIDKKLVASISNGEELSFDVLAGEHGLVCDVWSATNEQKVNIAPGTKRVVYELRLKMGLLKNKFEFIEIEKE